MDQVKLKAKPRPYLLAIFSYLISGILTGAAIGYIIPLVPETIRHIEYSYLDPTGNLPIIFYVGLFLGLVGSILNTARWLFAQLVLKKGDFGWKQIIIGIIITVVITTPAVLFLTVFAYAPQF